MVAANLLALLVCPETHQDLRLATEKEIQVLNQAIGGKQLQTVQGKPVSELLDGALMRQDTQVAYPIREGIPVLLISEGLKLGSLNLARG